MSRQNDSGSYGAHLAEVRARVKNREHLERIADDVLKAKRVILLVMDQQDRFWTPGALVDAVDGPPPCAPRGIASIAVWCLLDEGVLTADHEMRVTKA